jgi:hypothetical protein
MPHDLNESRSAHSTLAGSHAHPGQTFEVLDLRCIVGQCLFDFPQCDFLAPAYDGIMCCQFGETCPGHAYFVKHHAEPFEPGQTFPERLDTLFGISVRNAAQRAGYGKPGDAALIRATLLPATPAPSPTA